jgi:putative membrane protein
MASAYLLAIAHHLVVFSLVALLAAQTALMRPGLSLADLRLLALLDRAYGLVAALVLAIGFSRAVWGVRGWAYYADNAIFWAKIGCFVGVGLLSMVPTLKILAWRKQRTLPRDAEVASIRRWLAAEWTLFACIPLLAAALGLGIGH